MIVEEVGRTDEAVWPSPPYLGPKVVLGGVYRNRKRDTITVRELDEDDGYVSYDYDSGGRVESLDDEELEDLQKELVMGGWFRV